MKPATAFGKCLRHYRVEHGLTTAMMAKALQVSIAYMSYIEIGDRVPSPKILDKLVAQYGFDRTHLIHLIGDVTLDDRRKTISLEGLSGADKAKVFLLVEQLRQAAA